LLLSLNFPHISVAFGSTPIFPRVFLELKIAFAGQMHTYPARIHVDQFIKGLIGS
jgi:hypothetical protein